MDDKQFRQLMDKLSEISRLLGAVAKPTQSGAQKALLSTPLRIRMFKLMNGQRSTKEIAAMTERSKRNVDIFVKELHEAGLVSLIPLGKGKTKCPKKV